MSDTNTAPATNGQSAPPAAPTTPPAVETPPAGQPPATPAQGTPPAADSNANPPAPAAAVPENYDLKIPENSLLKPEHLTKIAAFAKEQGFNNETAQKLLERESNAIAEHQTSEVAAYQAKVNGWMEQAKQDQELGGPNFTANVETARQALERFGTPQLKQELDASGLGNHPELMRLLFRIGKSMKPDSLINGSPAGVTKSAADTLYGS